VDKEQGKSRPDYDLNFMVWSERVAKEKSRKSGKRETGLGWSECKKASKRKLAESTWFDSAIGAIQRTDDVKAESRIQRRVERDNSGKETS